MPLQEDPANWLAYAVSFNDFERYGLSNADYNTLLAQAALRAKNHILNNLGIPQTTLDEVVDGDSFQLAYQHLTVYEFLCNYIGLYGNTFPFREYESPEDETVEQFTEDLDRWINLKNYLKKEAYAVLENFIPSQAGVSSAYDPLAYNWT